MTNALSTALISAHRTAGLQLLMIQTRSMRMPQPQFIPTIRRQDLLSNMRIGRSGTFTRRTGSA